MSEAFDKPTEREESKYICPEHADVAPDWIWEADSECIITYSSSAVRDILGYEPEEVISKSIFNFTHPEGIEECKQLMLEMPKYPDRVVKVVAHVVGKNGCQKVLESRCRPLIDEQGQFAGIRGVSRDVTEEDARGHAIREALEQYQTLVENSPTGIYIVQDERIVFANSRIADLMDYTLDEVLGTNVWRYVYPDDIPRLKDYYQRRLAGESVPDHYQARGITKTGQVRYFDCQVSLVTYNGRPAVLLNTVDVTEQRLAQEELEQSEEKYRQLVESANDWLWSLNKEGYYTYASPKVFDVLGYTPKEIVGKTPFDLMPKEEAERVKGLFLSIIESKQQFALVKNTMVRRDGELIVVESSGTPIFENSEYCGYRGINRDVTAQVKAEEALRQRTSELEAVLHAFPDLYFWLDNNGRIVDYQVGRALEEFSVSAEFIGSYLKDVFPPDVGKKLQGAVSRALDNSTVVAVEYTMQGKTGPEYFEARAAPLSYDSQVMLIIRNITERRRAEEAVKNSQRRLLDIINFLPDATFAIDTKGRVIAWNRAIEEMTGVKAKDMLGKDNYEYALPFYGERRPLLLDLVLHPDTEKEQNYPGLERKNGCLVAEVFIPEIAENGLYLWAKASPLYDSAGNVVGAIESVRDVTERKRIEQALREERDFTSAILNTAGALIVVMSREGRVVRFNRSCEELSGYSSEEVVGKIPWDIIIPEDEREGVKKFFNTLLSGVSTTDYENHWLTRSGERRLIRWSATPLTDSAGKVTYVIGVGLDITEIRRAQDALRDAEAKYISLVEESLVGVYIIQGGKFSYVNPRFSEIFGYSQEEILNMRVLDLVAPESRELVSQNIRKRFAGEVKSIRYTFKAVRKDGEMIDVEALGTSTYFEGAPAIVGSVLDITDRVRHEEVLRTSEERFRRLFENTPEIVVLLKDNKTVEVNRAATTILGYSPEELYGATPWDVSPEYQPDGSLSSEAAKQHVKAALKGEREEFSWVLLHKNGSPVYTEVSLVSYEAEGETYVLSIVRDVTERKLAEESRRELERQLEEQKRHFYRDTIFSVTDGKLSIVEEDGIQPFKTNAEVKTDVDEAYQVADARHEVEAYCREHGLNGERLESFMIGVGEAITNAIKHGRQGRVYIGQDGKSVWVGVSDKGKGIESLTLPKATLLKGFSTKASMGLGYSIMLDVCDQIYLNTGPQGTTVVLVKNIEEPVIYVQADQLPDTWSNIPEF